MQPRTTRQWTIAARPIGRPLSESDFELREVAHVPLEDGQVRTKTLYLSFDPSQKAWMENAASYSEPTEIGSPMPGRGIGQITETRSSALAIGDFVAGPLGWRESSISDPAKLDPVTGTGPLTLSLSVTGVTGFTAYFGLLHLGKPKPGDTLVISGAAGAVGSIVGQIGKIAGCRVNAIDGVPEKSRYLTEELRFDGAIDYKHEKVRHRLRELCPDGVNIFYDNVGGEILNDALARLARHARVVICGGISRYNADPRNPQQMPEGPRNYYNVVFTHATIQGFIAHDFADQFPIAKGRLSDWYERGLIKHKEDIQHGFENAPKTLLRLFAGANTGKQILKVAEPD